MPTLLKLLIWLKSLGSTRAQQEWESSVSGLSCWFPSLIPESPQPFCSWFLAPHPYPRAWRWRGDQVTQDPDRKCPWGPGLLPRHLRESSYHRTLRYVWPFPFLLKSWFPSNLCWYIAWVINGTPMCPPSGPRKGSGSLAKMGQDSVQKKRLGLGASTQSGGNGSGR